MATGIKMTKKNRLAILQGARQILANKKNWATGALRRKRSSADDGYAYCLLGACEESAYRLGLVDPNGYAFATTGGNERSGIGYDLGRDLSLYLFSKERNGLSPDAVNDQLGYDMTIELLDNYIKEVKAGRARKPE